jgi:hypothetical protein
MQFSDKLKKRRRQRVKIVCQKVGVYFHALAWNLDPCSGESGESVALVQLPCKIVISSAVLEGYQTLILLLFLASHARMHKRHARMAY